MEQQALIKKRKPIIAALMSFLFPGWGQLYNGQIKKAVAYFLVIPACYIIFGICRTTTSFNGIVYTFLFIIAYRIIAAIDAWISAKKQKDYTLKKCNTWYYYLLSICIMCAIIIVLTNINILGIKSYKTPSVSMLPTFEPGDIVIKDLKAYKNKPIDYGDIIVFDYKGDEWEGSGEWVFRVAGLPNDSIRIDNNTLYINGQICEKTFVRDTTVYDLHYFEFTEQLPNGHTHNIYIFDRYFRGEKAPDYKTIVPEDNYFVLGDNRDNAMDSRFIGCIKRESITGQVVYIAYGSTCKRVNIDLRKRY